MHFITKEGALKVRTINNSPATVNDLAKSLDARFVVLAADWHAGFDCPIWGVYDMRKASTKVPGGGVSLPLPMKEFVHADADGAVMYALTMSGVS